MHNALYLTQEKHHILTLLVVVNTAARAYWKLLTFYNVAEAALAASPDDWEKCGVHANHVKSFAAYKKKNTAVTQQVAQLQQGVLNRFYDMIFVGDVFYPKLLTQLPDYPPVLFVRGSTRTLNQAQIAIVGTRKPSAAARDICEHFAQYFAQEGMWVTSGLADGIDKHAHIGALKQNHGRTIAVLGCGITQCYPKQNQGVYDAILQQGGSIISEFLPDTRPAAYNFPRRNRIVSGLSLATLVVEAAQKSGSLITATLAAEQGKSVFAIPGHIYNAQAKGCHQLIREGAILVDEPAQVIDDINLPRRLHRDVMQPSTTTAHHTLAEPTQDVAPVSSHMISVAEENPLPNPQAQQEQTPDIQHANTAPPHAKHPADLPDTLGSSLLTPSHEAQQQAELFSDHAMTPETQDEMALPAHLEKLLNQLDWVGQDMDRLIEHTGLHIAELSGQLMELELHGLVVQQGGLYLRCRA